MEELAAWTVEANGGVVRDAIAGVAPVGLRPLRRTAFTFNAPDDDGPTQGRPENDGIAEAIDGATDAADHHGLGPPARAAELLLRDALLQGAVQIVAMQGRQIVADDPQAGIVDHQSARGGQTESAEAMGIDHEEAP